MPSAIAGYDIVSKLGQGGMGTVYEVRETDSGQKLALKVLKTIEDESLLAAERFRREFSLLSRLRHPNLVSVYRSDIADGVPFYTMELVTGQTLNQVPTFVRRLGPQLWGPQNPQAFKMVLQLLDAIEYMHQHGIVHRDLKPSNIMLTLEGVIKVMDFGLAREISSDSVLTKTGNIVGTIEYSSPEQLGEQAEVDTRSDLYSIGVILYEITTGRLPFPGDMVTVISHIIFDPPTPPGDANENLPPLLNNAILKLLEKRPENRFQSVDELRRVFLELAAQFNVEVDAASTARIEPDEQPFVVPGERLLFVPRLLVHEVVQDAADQFLKALGQGHNRFAIVEGEEGMGKTRLVEELARRAERRGLRVLQAHCDANDPFPYHAIQPIVLQARRRLEGVELTKALGQGAELLINLGGPSETAPPSSNVDKYRLFDAFSRMLQAMASHPTTDLRPGLLLVDDVHWADADSLELLSYLVRDLVYHPEESGRPAWGIVWLMDVNRDPNVSERIQQVTANHDISRLRLEPFTQAELTDFVASILGEHERAQLLGPLLFKETNGNPGFTYETLKGMVDSGNLVPERGGWRLVGGVEDGELADVLPASLRDAYSSRLRRLPADAHQLLVVAAMLGSEFNYQELRHCACVDEGKVLNGLDVLLQHRFLREVRGRRKGQLTFVLPQIRKYLISDISFAGQQQMHLQILRALEAAYEAGDRRVLHALAWHARRAGVVDKSLKYLLLAAQAAARTLAHDRASDLFDQASALPGFNDAMTPELREMMYEVVMSATRYPRAAEIARHAAQLETDAARRADWLHRLGRALMGLGKNDEALHYFNASLETLGFKTYHGGALVGSVAMEFLRHLPGLRHPDAVANKPAPTGLVEALEVMLDLPNLFYFVQMPQRDLFFFNNILRAFNVVHHIHAPGLQTLVNATYSFMLAMVAHPPMGLIRQFLERAVSQMSTIEDNRIAIEVARFCGYCYYVIGDFDKAMHPIRYGMERAEQCNNVGRMAQLEVFLALTRWWTGPVPELNLAASTALNKCEATGDVTFLAIANKAMCAALGHQGEFARGHQLVEAALAHYTADALLVEPLSLRFGEAFLCYMERNDEATVLKFGRLKDQWIAAGLDRVHANLYGAFAASAMLRLVQTGRSPKTPASFERINRWIAAAHSIGHEVHFLHGWASVLEAQVHVLHDHFPKAMTLFEKGLAQVQKAAAPLVEADCRLGFAETLYAAALTATQHRAEILEQAQIQRQAAIDLATRLGAPVLLRQATALV